MRITLAVRVKRAKLDDIVAKIPGAVDYATALAADAVVARAQSLAPVRSGDLKGSIKKIGGAGNYFVTATMSYAGYVEWGTRFMAAQPYLRPAGESIPWTAVAAAFFRQVGL